MEYQKEIEILKLLKKLNLCVSSRIDRIFAEYDLTASQCEILHYLMEHENQAVVSTDLHMDLGTSRASVSMILKRLRQKGYVVFRCSPGDDRQKRIFLTERACRLRGKIDSEAVVIDEYLYQGISQKERQSLEHMIRKMLKNLQNADRGDRNTAEEGIRLDKVRRAEAPGKMTEKRRPKYDSNIA